MPGIHRTSPASSPVFASALACVVCLFALAPVPAGEEVVIDFGDGHAQGQGIPAPWRLLGNPTSNPPEFNVEEDKQHAMVLRLHARGDQSDGIYRPLEVDLAKTPFINFSWKVTIHPDGQIGTAKDDQAVQIQLNFGRRRLKRQVLSYGYDAAAKVGRWYDDSSFIAVNRVLVLDSGKENLGEWISHSRNLVRDYQKCYGAPPPRLTNISIYCDSNDSNSESLGYCTKITFSEKPLNGADEAQ